MARDPTQRSRVRRAWMVGGSVVAVLALTFSAFHTVNVLAHEEETIVTVVDATDVSMIDVTSSAGSVEIIGSDRDRITVTTQISDGLVSTRHSHEVDGERLLLRASCPPLVVWCDADFTVAAPSGVSVLVRSGRGSVRVTGVRGDVDAASDHGGITVTDVSGELTLDTDSGSVTATEVRSTIVDARSDNGSVRLAFVCPPEDVTADTDHGNVVVTVPQDDTAYDVDAPTDAGVTDDPDARRSIKARSDRGNVTVTEESGADSQACDA